MGAAVADGSLRLPSTGALPVVAATDGSGGDFASDPKLCRVGWSWAVLRPDGSLWGAMHGGLEGWPQTIPRAEVQAVVEFLEHVDLARQLILYVDCQYVVDGILRVQAGWRPIQATAHGQLWSCVAAH